MSKYINKNLTEQIKNLMKEGSLIIIFSTLAVVLKLQSSSNSK